jgi:GT2 family glycosyltransferase
LRLLAAICTNRSPVAAGRALAAVARQVAALDGAEAIVVTSGLAPAEHEAHAVAAAEIGAVAVPAPTGLSAARNRALAGAGDEDVIAFLDDDAVPAPDWLERLAARWREAPAEVACIAGAIVPRWESPPPGWVSARIAPAFSLLDLGPGLAELDPLAGSEGWGANISFRAAPLREVGGFDPGLGVWEGFPVFGEESAVQRALVRRGHRLLYAGDVRVEHLIGSDRMRLAALWRREYYRGVTAYLDGATPAGGVARAGKALAGLAIALAGFRGPLAAERLLRMARSLGVATAPLARRRLRSRGWQG